MDANEIKQAVEGFQMLSNKAEQIYKRVIHFSARDPEMAANNMQRLDPINEKIDFIEYAIYESDVLSERESAILEIRALGFSYVDVGKYFGLGGERIRQILNGIYKSLAAEYNVAV